MYERTHSAVLAAITFVSSIVPAFAGGVTLAWLADRFPRRAVMIACDLVRCVLVLVMAVRGMPLAALVVLLFWVTLIGAPFLAARAALMPVILPGERYIVGNAITLTTNQFAQVIGFAAGGALVGLLGIRGCLLADAATFAVSALIVRLRVTDRPPAAAPVSSLGFSLSGAVQLVFRNPALRVPMLFGWLAAFYDAPEGVVTPLARGLGGGAATVGLILAAEATGVTIGTLAVSRLIPPAARQAWMGPLAVGCTAVLIVFALRPPLAGTLVLLGVSGLCAGYQTAANAAFVRAAPAARRGAAFGLAQGGINLGQGTVMILAGAVAQVIAPAYVIAICGGVGTCAAAALAVEWRRRQRAEVS